MSMPKNTRSKRRGIKLSATSGKNPRDLVVILRNVAIGLNAVVYLTFPVLALFVNISMPEIINDKDSFDPVSHWAKYLTILGAPPAAVALSSAVFIEAFMKLKNNRFTTLTMIAIFGALFSLVSLFIGLLAVFVFELALRGVN